MRADRVKLQGLKNDASVCVVVGLVDLAAAYGSKARVSLGEGEGKFIVKQFFAVKNLACSNGVLCRLGGVGVCKVSGVVRVVYDDIACLELAAVVNNRYLDAIIGLVAYKAVAARCSLAKVVEILARELGVEMNEITKFGGQSNIMYNKTK